MAKSSMRQFDSLPEDAVVYRAILRKQWINEDTGRVKSDAYFLRSIDVDIQQRFERVEKLRQEAGESALVKKLRTQGLIKWS